MLSFNREKTFLDLNGNDALHFCILNYVPSILYTQSNFPRWFSKILGILLFGKKAHTLFKSSKNPNDYLSFFRLWTRCKIESKKCHSLCIQNIEYLFLLKLCTFWDIVRRNRSDDGIPVNVKLNRVLSSHRCDVSELFLFFIFV